MKTLLEDYKRKLNSINELIINNKNNGSIMDQKRSERLNTKASEYRSFIIDIERMIERSNLNLPVERIDESLSEIRRAVADYIKSEGCSCCQDRVAHQEAGERLGKLLGAKPYDDGIGYNFSPYASK